MWFTFVDTFTNLIVSSSQNMEEGKTRQTTKPGGLEQSRRPSSSFPPCFSSSAFLCFCFLEGAPWKRRTLQFLKKWKSESLWRDNLIKTHKVELVKRQWSLDEVREETIATENMGRELLEKSQRMKRQYQQQPMALCRGRHQIRGGTLLRQATFHNRGNESCFSGDHKWLFNRA